MGTQGESWEKLFNHAQYQNAKISPDEKYLAVSVLSEGKSVLAFLERKTMKASCLSKGIFRNALMA